jgi:hypothetical protein
MDRKGRQWSVYDAPLSFQISYSIRHCDRCSTVTNILLDVILCIIDFDKAYQSFP